MAITRTIWKNSFEKDRVPSWTCPSCQSGNLKGDKTTIKVIESAASKAAHSDEDWDPEWISGHFGGTLKCSNAQCGDLVLVMGKMFVDPDSEYDEENDTMHYIYREFLIPQAFFPSLHIFQIHPDVPRDLASAIVESFKLYWIDISSCANKIRIVVELIMDEQKITRTFTTGGKRKSHSLHKRIELFKVTKPEEADYLMAIKWIGNSGSHTNGGLTKDDILDAYEILEFVTTKLYEKDSHRLKKLSKEINKKKKPIAKKRAIKKKK
jgi:hypothetical protein